MSFIVVPLFILNNFLRSQFQVKESIIFDNQSEINVIEINLKIPWYDNILFGAVNAILLMLFALHL